MEGGFNVVFDAGTTKPISFNKGDFLDDMYHPTQPLLMQGISHGLHIARIGTLAWHLLDNTCEMQVIQTKGYYVPEFKLHLLSPQAYFHENKGGHM